jgi:hypothetical protein
MEKDMNFTSEQVMIFTADLSSGVALAQCSRPWSGGFPVMMRPDITLMT